MDIDVIDAIDAWRTMTWRERWNEVRILIPLTSWAMVLFCAFMGVLFCFKACEMELLGSAPILGLSLSQWIGMMFVSGIILSGSSFMIIISMYKLEKYKLGKEVSGTAL